MIEIVDYRESWPIEFQEIASVLRGGLGGLIEVADIKAARGQISQVYFKHLLFFYASIAASV